jgi:hypothetical protein
MNEREYNNNSFHNVSGSFFCPACGTKYSTDEFDMVVERDNGYVVSVKCHNCQLTVMMNVVSADKVGFSKSEQANEESITANDVIEFGKGLKKFDGNFRREFTRIDR